MKTVTMMTDIPTGRGATHRERLARSLGFGIEPERLWTDQELGAVYRHQLSAPIMIDLTAMDERQASQVRVLSEAQGLLLRSFSDLFQHPSPPVDLLVLTKDFAKSNQLTRQSALPEKVAGVLYYTAIAAALVRCHARITKLTAPELAKGFSWALAQPWIDEPTRRLLGEARRDVTPAVG